MTTALVDTDVPPAIAAWLATAPRLTPERIAIVRRLLGPAPTTKTAATGASTPAAA